MPECQHLKLVGPRTRLRGLLGPPAPVGEFSALVLTSPVHPAPPPRISWHLLLALLSPLASLLPGLLRDDRDRQVLALRQKVLILQHQAHENRAPQAELSQMGQLDRPEGRTVDPGGE